MNSGNNDYYSIFNIFEKWLLKITKSKKCLNLSNNANLVNAMKYRVKSAKSCNKNKNWSILSRYNCDIAI